MDTVHDKTLKQIYSEFKTSEKGLGDADAHARLQKFGLNELKQKKKISPITIFLQQFQNFVVYILIAAVLISVIIGFTKTHEQAFPEEFVDAIVIGIIIILNAVLGFIQEYRAERSIEALKKMTSLKATVMRDNKVHDIDAKLLVPGDLVLLESGDKVPADCRLIEIINFQTQEAALTGESLPVKKEVKDLAEKTPLADRINMVFAGTIVTAGKAKAIVTGTGMQSEIGKIATMIDEVESEETPLQKKLNQLGKWIGYATLVIAVVVFISEYIKEGPEHVLESFIIAVALAVAAIPEGLPAVVTISLAIGVQRMVKRNALIRKLPSVETLGSTTVICTDKTGTLTKNEMTVKKIFANGKVIDVSGSGYDGKGEFTHKGTKINPKEFDLLLQIGLLNNDASFDEKGVVGDPTEAALVISAKKAGLDQDAYNVKYKRKDEIPFTSERKIMTTMHVVSNKMNWYVKGAPEFVLQKCSHIYDKGKILKLSADRKKEILDANKQFASGALRVLGFAYAQTKDKKNAEKNLVFVGLQGMIDPPREQVKDAIAKCKKAGIKVVMITGDNELTAKAIAAAIGIEGGSMTGAQLDTKSAKELSQIVEEISIYARVNPEHKNKIVDALKHRGHVVAMTGDGVNDAPAIKKADIGISMGITGTDVAKESAHMILTDDNFASIVNAVEEGRGIYDNIKKFVVYLLSSNLGEVLTIFISIMIGLPLPLIAIMLLWINLVTDGIPALALSVDPADKNIMDHRPRKKKERILSNVTIIGMVLVGLVMAVGTLGLFIAEDPHNNLVKAQTMAFVTCVMFQLFNVLNCRSEFQSIFKVGLFSNMKVWLAIASSIVLQVIVVQMPFLNKFFQTVPLSGFEWLITIGVASSVLVFVEFYKWGIRAFRADLIR